MNQYKPDYVSSPAETIGDIMEYTPITEQLADALEQWCGVPARFWMARDRDYRESKEE